MRAERHTWDSSRKWRTIRWQGVRKHKYDETSKFSPNWFWQQKLAAWRWLQSSRQSPLLLSVAVAVEIETNQATFIYIYYQQCGLLSMGIFRFSNIFLNSVVEFGEEIRTYVRVMNVRMF